MTKPQLIEALQAYGEHPAKTWTKVEIRARLLELQGRDVEPSQRELNSSTLELMTRELRKAAKQKSALVAYCTNELEMVLTGNETKPQLEMKAMKLILQKAPGRGPGTLWALDVTASCATSRSRRSTRSTADG